MAREGYSGPVEVIEGKEGLIEVLSNVTWHEDRLLAGLGKDFLITRCSYKAFPTEALTHQPITAVLQVCREHGITHEEIDEILVETTTRGADILSDPSKYKPETRETADHSLPYVIAVAVVDGNVLPESFNDEKLRDPNIWELLPKIKVIADPEIDQLFPKVKRARVTIKTNDGNRQTAQTDVAKGAPEDPLTDDELIAKFRANGREVISTQRLDKIIESTWKFDTTPDLKDYMALLITDL
jgi:2-methylcitrate dehydratase